MSSQETMEDKIEELEERKEAARAGGGPERIQKQHDKGKLTARERIDILLDDDSFVEVNTLAEHRCTEFGMEKKTAPGDGVVTGWGTIEGRRVFVFAQDFTVIGGSLGEVHAKKICHIMDQAVKSGCPVIGLNDSAGARVQEGVQALSGYGEIFYRNSVNSGVVPQISVIMGPCAGGAVYSPALTDFVFMVDQTSKMFITGPNVIKTVTGEEVSMEELGGARVHCTTSGVADFMDANDEACLQRVRKLLSYLPLNNLDNPPVLDTGDTPDRMDMELREIVPADPKKAYDVRDVINHVMDQGTFLEVKEHYAKNIVTGFARLNGQSVGIIANQPTQWAGSLDVDASDKAARFIRFCDAFSIPIVNFVDVPGYLPGVDQEYKGIIRHGAKLLYAYSEATVPKLTVILRKAYGGSFLAMCSKDLGADYVIAWPTAEVAVMGPEGAVNIVFRREIQGADDPEAKRQEMIDEYRDRFANPYYASERMHVDIVIKPEETRPQLIEAMSLLANKRESRPKKKHGNMPV